MPEPVDMKITFAVAFDFGGTPRGDAGPEILGDWTLRDAGYVRLHNRSTWGIVLSGIQSEFGI